MPGCRYVFVHNSKSSSKTGFKQVTIREKIEDADTARIIINSGVLQLIDAANGVESTK